MPQDSQAELFPTYADNGDAGPLVTRGEVHRLGLWHKAARALVFYPNGGLLMQQRSLHKDLYAGLWDYSVGEHLQPGESFADGAQRGLAEELGLADLPLTPIGSERRQTFKGGDGSWHDREILQSFVTQYDPATQPPVQIDTAEVHQIAVVTPNEYTDWLSQHQDQLVPWFLDDLHNLGLNQFSK